MVPPRFRTWSLTGVALDVPKPSMIFLNVAQIRIFKARQSGNVRIPPSDGVERFAEGCSVGRHFLELPLRPGS